MDTGEICTRGSTDFCSNPETAGAFGTVPAGAYPRERHCRRGGFAGSALLVLLTIRHRIDITGKPTVSLPAAVMREFGFDRFAKSRALVELEGAGSYGCNGLPVGRCWCRWPRNGPKGKNASGSVP